MMYRDSYKPGMILVGARYRLEDFENARPGASGAQGATVVIDAAPVSGPVYLERVCGMYTDEHGGLYLTTQWYAECHQCGDRSRRYVRAASTQRWAHEHRCEGGPGRRMQTL